LSSSGWGVVIRSRWAFAGLIERQFGRCCLLAPSRGSLTCSPHLKGQRKPVFCELCSISWYGRR
jgi:hypothetical protein